jgi:hypothetical protein
MRASCRLRIDAFWSNRNLEQQVWEKEPPKRMTESPFSQYEKNTLQSFWKYKSLYFPTCGPKLTDGTLYESRSKNKFTTHIFQVIYFHVELGQFGINSTTVLPHCFSTQFSLQMRVLLISWDKLFCSPLIEVSALLSAFVSQLPEILGPSFSSWVPWLLQLSKEMISTRRRNHLT